MDKSSRLGTAANLKIKSHAKQLFTLFVLAAWLFSILACTRSVVQPWQVTATVAAGEPLPKTASLLNAPLDPSPSPAIPTETVAASAPLPTQTLAPTHTATPASETTEKLPILYYTQAGDTLPLVAIRFNVSVEEIITSEKLPPTGALLTPNQLLIIPNRLPETASGDAVLPDSEVVFSPSAVDFDIDEFVNQSGGYLSTYQEWLSTGWNSGADVVRRISIENSINPRLVLALIEYQGHWVYGQPRSLAEEDYPLGYNEFNHKGLYKQLSWVVQQVSIGYYGWRAGLITEITFPTDAQNSVIRLAPQLSAGSAALQYLFSKLYENKRTWSGALYGPESLVALHEQMFGNPWLRAQSVEPLYPPNLEQPPLELPFAPGRVWSLTGGPHSAWGPDGALAALDFAPSAMSSGCVESLEWVTAAAPGQIVRTGNGTVIIDLDGDGYEQTGWALLYMHVSTKDRIQPGTIVNTDDRLGHPSCEGGVSTGTHMHFARKYNGEWILADGPIPMVLGGWRAHAGDKPYAGTLTRNDFTVTACPCGSFETHIARPKPTP
ncbi:MAG: M23 family metallopeptidase [Anaerolineaceae bacterium]|nr:M23 family metallopeptidase [Anaerolineaceae bacterium]